MRQQIGKHNKDSIIAKHVKTGTWINKGAAPQDVKMTNRHNTEQEEINTETGEIAEKKSGGFAY